MAYTRDKFDAIKSDWVVTDNTTITDAGIAFAAFQDGRAPESPQKYMNWLSFLESVVLHDVTLADDKIFRSQPWVQHLKKKLGDCIEGVDVGDEDRIAIHKDVRSFAKSLRISLRRQLEKLRLHVEKTKAHTTEQVFARANSDLHRSLFYISLSSAIGLPYRPAYSREMVFSTVIPMRAGTFPAERPDIVAEVSAKLFEAVLQSARRYVANIETLGGPKLVVAKLPPIATLVAAEARRTGSWSEGLYNLRNSRAVKKFRKWVRDVIECVAASDGKGVRQLEQANRFIEGWGINPDEGIKYKTRSLGIGIFHSNLKFSLKYQFRDPVLTVPSHLSSFA